MSSDQWHFGVEAQIEAIFPDWDNYETTTVDAGPNISCQAESWYVTTTAMFQLSDEDSKPGLQFRVIAGFQF